MHEYPRPVKVVTPIATGPDSIKVFERIESYVSGSGFDVVILWALGSDAAVLFGREEEVMDVIRHVSENHPGAFLGAPIGEA